MHATLVVYQGLVSPLPVSETAWDLYELKWRVVLVAILYIVSNGIAKNDEVVVIIPADFCSLLCWGRRSVFSNSRSLSVVIARRGRRLGFRWPPSGHAAKEATNIPLLLGLFFFSTCSEHED